MTTIDIQNERLIVSVKGLHKVLAFRSKFEIPLSQVTEAEIDPAVARHPLSLNMRGIRLLGTAIPGFIQAGTYYTNGQLTFCDVVRAHKAITIHLENHRYQRLIIEVAKPVATVAAIQQAISAYHTA